jgi:hypothetical protein
MSQTSPDAGGTRRTINGKVRERSTINTVIGAMATIIAAAIAAVIATGWPPFPTHADCIGTAALASGENLRNGEEIRSKSGRHALKMENGRLVHYRDGQIIWYSEEYGGPGAYLRMKIGGDLYIYRDVRTRKGKSFGTGGNKGAHLEVQNDGDIVVCHEKKLIGYLEWPGRHGAR